MAFDPVEDVEEFHRKFGLLYEGKPRAVVGELGDFRVKFMHEELEEYKEAAFALSLLMSSEHEQLDEAEIAVQLAKQLDALVDLTYVVLGSAHLHGFDFREAWRRVHEANMKKVRAASAAVSKRGSAFDVVKPPGWEAPSHIDLVEDHIYRRQS